MAKAYLISGAPRVGKTTALLHLVKEKPMLATSTDALRMMLRGALDEPSNPELFRNRFTTERVNLMRLNPEKVLQEQNDESEIVWKHTVKYIESNLEDGLNIGVEGVAILPHLLANASFPYSVVFVVNLEDQTNFILEHARSNPHDWLHEYDDETLRSFCVFNRLLNDYYFREAQKFGFPIVVTSSDNFQRSMIETTRQITKQ